MNRKKNIVLKNLLPKIWYEKGYVAWRKSLKKKPKQYNDSDNRDIQDCWPI